MMTNRSTRCIQSDGYFYRRGSSYGNKCYLHCKDSGGGGICKARAHLINGQVIVQPNRPHTCQQNPNLVRLTEFKNNLCEAVSNDAQTALRKLYDRVARRYQDVRTQYTYTNAERTLKRYRQKSRPRIPQTLLEYADVMMSNQWNSKYTKCEGTIMSVETMRAGQNYVTIFADLDYVRSLDRVKNLCMDATFKVCPLRPKIYQFLTIMVQVDGKWLPITWALMERKTTLCYTVVLRKFRSMLRDGDAPRTFMIDFEPAMSTAIMIIFPAVKIIRCFFHHCQAITRKMRKFKGFKVYNTLKNWPRAKLFFRKLIALALLPHDKIIDAFDQLVLSADEDLQIYFDKLLEYYRRFWLEKVGPQKFSVYGHRYRTNNAQEAYHRVLGTTVIGKHPQIWTFTERLLQLVNDAKSDLIALNQGSAIRRERENRYILPENLLQRAWDLYIVDNLDIAKFLTAASHILRSFGQDILITDVQQIHSFQYINSYEDIERMFDIDVVYQIHEEQANGQIIDHPLHKTGCIGCGCKRFVNLISLPCYHWFACGHCTGILSEIAHQQNNVLTCSMCGTACEFFVEIFPDAYT